MGLHNYIEANKAPDYLSSFLWRFKILFSMLSHKVAERPFWLLKDPTFFHRRHFREVTSVSLWTELKISSLSLATTLSGGILLVRYYMVASARLFRPLLSLQSLILGACNSYFINQLLRNDIFFTGHLPPWCWHAIVDFMRQAQHAFNDSTVLTSLKIFRSKRNMSIAFHTGDGHVYDFKRALFSS